VGIKPGEARFPSEIADGREKGEIRDLGQDSPDEEDWEVQSYEVEVPVLCIELSRMPPWVTC
jgi:hypothetical protein